MRNDPIAPTETLVSAVLPRFPQDAPDSEFTSKLRNLTGRNISHQDLNTQKERRLRNCIIRPTLCFLYPPPSSAKHADLAVKFQSFQPRAIQNLTGKKGPCCGTISEPKCEKKRKRDNLSPFDPLLPLSKPSKHAGTGTRTEFFFRLQKNHQKKQRINGYTLQKNCPFFTEQ